MNPLEYAAFDQGAHLFLGGVEAGVVSDSALHLTGEREDVSHRRPFPVT
jgi:hypothetical protein